MDYTIRSGASTATIEDKGAQLKSLRGTDGHEYLWQRDPAYWSRSAPVLFPSVGRLREGRAVFEGVSYDMPTHGFARDSLFEVCAQEEGSVSFLLRSSDGTRRHYPYAFEFTVRFTLGPDGLAVVHTVKNTGGRTMCFALGGHPAFNCPIFEGDQFSDYELRLEKPEGVLSPTVEGGVIHFSQPRDFLHGGTAIALDYSLFSQDAIILEGLHNRCVSLLSRKNGRGLRFRFPDFEAVAFWTPEGKRAPLLCFEPWLGMGMRDDDRSAEFSAKKGVVSLGAGQVFSAGYFVDIL